MIDPTIITSAVTGFAASYIAKGDSAPMQTLDDLWYLALGRLTKFAELQKAKDQAEKEVSLTLYKNSIAHKLLEIPEENLQEPPLSIVGPALEASKYYIEEEELREMFANVIASSMDSSKSENVHPSFIEIIKQLSPRDAKNISLFKSRRNYPIASYKLYNILDDSISLIEPLVFSSNLEEEIIDFHDFSSVSNLLRLGLLSHSQNTLKNTELYKVYENQDFLKNHYDGFDTLHYEFIVIKDSLNVTPLGLIFINICL